MSHQEQWVEDWLKAVVRGASTMRQRRVASIEKHASIITLKRIAKKMGIHLLLVEDEEGNQVVAASTKPFKIIC